MDRYRLISSIVFLFVYLLVLYPIPTICTAVVLFIGYILLKNIGQGRLGEYSTIGNGREVRRQRALKEAKIYLSPYKNIWRNLKLSNKYCSLSLGSDGYSITAKEKISSYRTFSVVHSKVHMNEELWNMFCMTFSYDTTFDRLVELCNTFNVTITEDFRYRENVSVKNKSVIPKNNPNYIEKSVNQEKIDINNASEVEITALPGISIVMAKKLIQKREEIGGFKHVKDVCLFLHLKPHIEKQIIELIKVEKMKGSINIKRYEERKLDL